MLEQETACPEAVNDIFKDVVTGGTRPGAATPRREEKHIPRISVKGRMVDALAPKAEEGRGRLR